MSGQNFSATKEGMQMTRELTELDQQVIDLFRKQHGGWHGGFLGIGDQPIDVSKIAVAPRQNSAPELVQTERGWALEFGC